MSEYTIWKYKLKLGQQEIAMPQHAVLLSVQVQGAEICLWAFVDPTQAPEMRQFLVMGTGQIVSKWPGNHDFKFIATVQQGAYVWHVFEGNA